MKKNLLQKIMEITNRQRFEKERFVFNDFYKSSFYG